MADWIASLLLVVGGAFCLVAGIGIIRFRDVYGRMHAATKAGTFGLVLIAAGACLVATTWAEVLESAGVFLFLIATAPIGSHLIGRAAYRTCAPEDPGTTADQACAAFRGSASAVTQPCGPTSAESAAP